MNTLVVLGGPDGERDISFPLEATLLLAASPDVETTLATVARLSLPTLAPGAWLICARVTPSAALRSCTRIRLTRRLRNS